MPAYDLKRSVEGFPVLDMSRPLEELDHGASFTRLASFDDGGLHVGVFSGESPWELHPSGDEMVYVVDGRVTFVLRGEDGSRSEYPVDAGQATVVPKGVWHKQLAHGAATVFSVTPEPSHISFDDVPAIED